MKKQEKGITLVALVVTIIVLLILAGIAISLTIGNNGIFSRAQVSKQKSEISQIIESARLDILEKETENLGGIYEKDLEEILNKYGKLSNNEEQSILDKTLTTNEKKYDIKVKEIYDGPFTEDTTISFKLDGGEILPEITGSYTVKKGTTWEEWDYKWNIGAQDTGSIMKTDDGNIGICDNYSSTAGYNGYFLVDEEGNCLKYDTIIEKGIYRLGSGANFGY